MTLIRWNLCFPVLAVGFSAGFSVPERQTDEPHESELSEVTGPNYNQILEREALYGASNQDMSTRQRKNERRFNGEPRRAPRPWWRVLKSRLTPPRTEKTPVSLRPRTEPARDPDLERQTSSFRPFVRSWSPMNSVMKVGKPEHKNEFDTSLHSDQVNDLGMADGKGRIPCNQEDDSDATTALNCSQSNAISAQSYSNPASEIWNNNRRVVPLNFRDLPNAKLKKRMPSKSHGQHRPQVGRSMFDVKKEDETNQPDVGNFARMELERLNGAPPDSKWKRRIHRKSSWRYSHKNKRDNRHRKGSMSFWTHSTSNHRWDSRRQPSYPLDNPYLATMRYIEEPEDSKLNRDRNLLLEDDKKLGHSELLWNYWRRTTGFGETGPETRSMS